MTRFINDDKLPQKAGRKAPKISIQDLQNQLNKLSFWKNGKDAYSLLEYLQKDIKLNPDCIEELANNITDSPNLMMGTTINGTPLLGFRTLPNGLTFYGMQLGDDSGYPLFLIIYYDGKRLRAYLPTYGNPWNTDCKCQIGQEIDTDIFCDKIVPKYIQAGLLDPSFAKPYFDWTTKQEEQASEAYLQKYGLTDSTLGFHWNAIQKDIETRIAVI